MQKSTFTSRPNDRISVRPAWVVVLADLGRLSGEQLHLIGVVRDINSEVGSIDFGLAAPLDIADVESRMGKTLAQLAEAGATVEAHVRELPEPTRLVRIQPIEQLVTAKLSKWGATSSMRPPLTDRVDDADKDFRALHSEHDRRAAEFECRRQKSLALRQTWDISQMTHRGDFPAWIPGWVKELIKESSRSWLELPNAPAAQSAPTEISGTAAGVQSRATSEAIGESAPSAPPAPNIFKRLLSTIN